MMGIQRSVSAVGVLASLLLLASAALARPAACLAYEPGVVTLTGVITRHMNYGPPNYGEDPAHDDQEIYWRLDLPRPICVRGDTSLDPNDINTESVSNIRHFELVYMNGYPKGGGWLGRRAAVTGMLFHAITGHHHTEVLITVSRQSRIR